MAERDLVVVGAGAAGLSVANVAARLGLAVTLIEQGEMGGECLNTGCVPSKALLACAHVAEAAREAGRFGVRLPPPEIDWHGVLAHVRGTIAAIAPVDSAERYRVLGCEVLRGRARLAGPHAVEVEGRVIAARRIVLAVGSRPAIPPLPGLDGVPYLTNETVFQLEERPEHLLILGAGAMGVEMAPLDALGLDAAGVASTPRGIATDLALRSVTNRRVWAVGDCADPEGAGPRRYTHVASQHAGVVVRGALFRLPARLSYAALPRVVYTEPELAWVGLTEAEARSEDRACTVLKAPLSENDRAVAEGRTAGLAKIIVDRRGRILGAGALAPAAGEMAAALGLLIGRRGGARALAALVVAYPTRFEVLKKAAGNLFMPTLFGTGPRRAARLLARMS